MSKITELSKKLQEVKENVRNQVKAALFEALQPVFTELPEVNSIGWQQYIPYFCDGDACEFSVYAYEPKINDMDYDAYEEWRENEEEDVLLTGVKFQRAQEISEKIIYSIDEELLEMIGEGEVTVYRDGTIKVEYCDHD